VLAVSHKCADGRQHGALDQCGYVVELRLGDELSPRRQIYPVHGRAAKRAPHKGQHGVECGRRVPVDEDASIRVPLDSKASRRQRAQEPAVLKSLLCRGLQFAADVELDEAAAAGHLR
jgi:hypothetical protein